MRCARCEKPIFEGDDGWFSQEPVTSPDAPGFTFMDRVSECDGAPHSPKVAEGRRLPPEHMTVPGNVTLCLACQTECQPGKFGCRCCGAAQRDQPDN